MYKAQPKQVLFHYAEAEEVFYGGAAGGGKSYAILWDAVAKAQEYKNIRIAIFRRTYPELEKSLIYEFMKDIPSNWYKYSKNEHKAIFYSTGSVIEFNHCQYEHDVFKFQSAQYDYLYFDELTHFTEFIYTYLATRVRKTNSQGFTPQIKSASNPGNIGHLWVKKRFIKIEDEDGSLIDVEPNAIITREDKETGATYHTQFIPANLSDNEILTGRDPTYRSRLERQDSDTRKALLDGDWDVFQGQFFKEWRKGIHVCEPFEIPNNWKRFRAMDWGYTNPSCCLWFAVSPDKRLYVYRELYKTQLTTQVLAQTIDEMSFDVNGKREEISYTVADPSIWSTTQFEKGESIAYQLSTNNVSLLKADNNRLGGAARVRDYLRVDEDGKPFMQIFSSCFNLVRTLPALVHDDKNPEDVNTEGEDHAYDALRYGVMSHVIPKAIKNSENIQGTFMEHFRKKKQQRMSRLYVGGDK